MVPVYNGAATLAGCLDALYASDHEDFEVIVVDDGSTDGTREIASRYPCRVLSLAENRGAAQAKNLGAQEALGDILFFTDADVHVSRQTLSYVAEDLSDPDVDGVVGLLSMACPYANFASQFKNLWMHFTYRRQPRRVGLFYTSAAALRRDIFLKEGGFDTGYTGASITEDIEFGQRLLGLGYRLAMDQRLTVEHNKRYTAGEVLRTDLSRARGLTQTWLRNRLSGIKSVHYASVPWYFGAGIASLGIATLFALLALLSLDSGFLWGASAFILAALALNAPLLVAVGRWRGAGFMLQSAGFLLADLYVSGLGVAWAALDFARGKRY